MFPAVEGAPPHSNGFKTVAATVNGSAQNARVECEQDDFMAEGSDVLLDRLY